MSKYLDLVAQKAETIKNGGSGWTAINPEYAARMELQNRFKTGIDIARYTADIMRKDMAEYDADSSQYTQSLGCWHGFTAQQMMMAVKRHRKTTNKSYVYLSGWMVAALRSDFGPLPDQSMHEKTAVSGLIEEIYTFLRQADARELRHLFVNLDEARAKGGDVDAAIAAIDNHETHVVPIIADIDAGFGNEEATYLLAKKMIEAGACCIQLENQVSDAKQCGHQDGKVTVPHEDFLSKINAVRYAFLELGVENGVIVARTDSLGAGLTQRSLFHKSRVTLLTSTIHSLNLKKSQMLLLLHKASRSSPKAAKSSSQPVCQTVFMHSVTALAKNAVCLTASLHFRTVQICSGSKLNVQMLPRSVLWLIASVKLFQMQNWSITTRQALTGH